MKLNRSLLLAASTSPELVDLGPEDLNLPTDYTFAEYLLPNNSWGQSFYKIYNTKLDYYDAKAQCESDGSFLAIPRSKAEEDFLFGLFPDDSSIWIGINDIEQEGLFLAVDGREITWTNWGPGEPNGGLDENAVEILYEYGRKYWNDVTVKKLQKFICAINIEGKLFISELHLGIILHVKTNIFI